MASQPPIVTFRDVEKRYGNGPLILDRISFTAQRGDFISLIGPSGCGKSTILKLISALSPISGGELVVEGVHVDEPARGLDASRLFVRQRLALVGRGLIQRHRERTEELRRFLGLAGAFLRRQVNPRRQ